MNDTTTDIQANKRVELLKRGAIRLLELAGDAAAHDALLQRYLWGLPPIVRFAYTVKSDVDTPIPEGMAMLAAAGALLETIPEGDSAHSLGVSLARLIDDALRPQSTIFAYYTAEGIWATGRTPEEAIETFVQEGKLSQEEIEALGPMQTAPMTARLAEYVERHGFECGRDQYRVLASGMLDMVV